MKEIELIGNIIPSLGYSLLALEGDNLSGKVCFHMARYVDGLDLSTLNCIIKTMNSQKKADVVIPQMIVLEKTLQIVWTISRNTTAASGVLQLQLEFYRAEGDVVWQSHKSEFTVASSLNVDEIFEQTDPTVFSQWETRVNGQYDAMLEKYNLVSESITKINQMSQELDEIMGTLPSIASPVALSASAGYENGFYNLDIENLPSKLPENYTVTFAAPTAFQAGDKIRINGVAHPVNLYERGYAADTSIVGGSGKKTGSGYVFLNANGTNWGDVISNVTAIGGLKVNTKYTLIADIKESSLKQNFWVTDMNNPMDPYTTTTNWGDNRKGLQKHLIHTKASFTAAHRLFRNVTPSRTNGVGTITLRIMLLEGDYTSVASTPLPANYWENTYGEFSISGYGANTVLANGAFGKDQTITLSVGLSGAYFN